MKNYFFLLLVLSFITSCKKSDNPLEGDPLSQLTYSVDSVSTQPGFFLTLKASNKITRDTLSTMLGDKHVLLFKIDSFHYAFWIPVISPGTYSLDLKKINAENSPTVVIRKYDVITNPTKVITDIINGYSNLADSLEKSNLFNKNSTKNIAFLRQLILQFNQNLTQVSSEEKLLLAYQCQNNKPKPLLVQNQPIDTTYIVERKTDTDYDISQQVRDDLIAFNAKEIEAFNQAKRVAIAFLLLYPAAANPVALVLVSAAAVIEFSHLIVLVEEASALSSKAMNTCFKAFDEMREENGHGTNINPILTNDGFPLLFRYIVKYKTMEKSDESSPISVISTAIKAAYELEENGRSIKSTFEKVKNKFSTLFEKISVNFSPFVSPVLETAKEKVARIKNRFISVTNVSNPNMVITAVDDGVNGLKLSISNPAKNIKIETSFTFELTYAQDAINNKISVIQQVKFSPDVEDNTFTDPRDGQVYKIKQIGTQIWMTQNLNYVSLGSLCYDENILNCSIYGRLYNWETALNVAPPGWHLPSDTEWSILTSFLGGDSIAGNKLKETGNTHWLYFNTGATNSSGFTALPGGEGFGLNGISYGALGYNGNWWTSTESEFIDNKDYAYSRNISNETGIIYRDFQNKTGSLFSVRCVKDKISN